MDRVRPATLEEWTAAVERDPRATFFHTPAWIDIVRTAIPQLRPTPIAVGSGAGPPVVLPLVRMPILKGLTGRLEGSALGAYGGPLASEGGGSSELGALVREALTDQEEEVVLTEGPFRPIAPGWDDVQEVQTHLLRIPSSGDLEGGYRKGHRSTIRKAFREGVETRLLGVDRLDELVSLYALTRSRWNGEPWVVFPRALFADVLERGVLDDRVRAHGALRDGRLIGVAIVFLQGSTAVYWFAATSGEGRDTGAGNALIHRALEDAAEAGCSWSDFLSSGGNATVARFKSGFGAEAVSYRIHRRAARGVGGLLSRLRPGP